MSHLKAASYRLKIVLGLVGFAVLLAGNPAQAGAREQAKRVFDRIAGVPPTASQLDAMQALIDVDDDNVVDDSADWDGALTIALEAPGFYNVTIKNMVTPWTNEQQTQFADLNDYTATVIGLIRDNDDFRKVLYDDVIYVGTSSSLASYSNSNNQHYVDLEASGANLGDPSVLERETQTNVTGLMSSATAGVMTTRAAAKSFFVAGTNRAMFRFTLMNFLCNDLEQVKDTTRTPDRIRQDVSRSPGGDSRIFMNSCVGCHSGMDPLAQAFAYYEWTGEEGTEDGELEYTHGSVQEKYLINADNFRYGYATPDDSWDNYWRDGQNSALGWSDTVNYGVGGCTTGSCQGAKTLGIELANSNAFAQCQMKQVFETVCLHPPATEDDHSQIETMVGNFSSGYNMKNAFGDAAYYCRGD